MLGGAVVSTVTLRQEGVKLTYFLHFSFQTKYTLIDEQDIPLVENYAFEVSFQNGFLLACVTFIQPASGGLLHRVSFFRLVWR